MKRNVLSIQTIKNYYRDGAYSVRQLWQEIHSRAKELEHMNIWIHLLNEEEIEPYLQFIEANADKNLPLWGIPFAIKDNIDLKGISTTAACPEFSFVPKENAYVVQKLLEAGALPIGKTNLDQFATGLVGTRSPYGEVHNAYREEYISGGSSSGSAVSVAMGLTAFALGTDTAGSGRVPASLNNLVGWKPSVGAWSNRGVVPACESIDCITVFANSVDDAECVDGVVRSYDDQYRYSKKIGHVVERRAEAIYLPDKEPVFYGEHKEAYREKWNEVVSCVTAHYENVKYLDTSLLSEAASMLYDGPWVAERYAGLKEYLDTRSDTLFPVTGEIICGAAKKNLSAVQLFEVMHRLQEIKKVIGSILKDCVLLMPTNGGTFTRRQVAAEPISTNSQMGLYTNHCNLLDLCALNVPVGFAEDNLPMGVTLFTNSGDEGILAQLGRALSDEMTQSYVPLAVCGLHMKGYPLETQLLSLGAVYDYTTKTSPDYKLYELNTEPPKPGLVKSRSEGKEQEIEVWDIPEKNVGKFLSMIPSPLGLGKITTEDGSKIIGFICDACSVQDARDITAFGGWRYRA